MGEIDLRIEGLSVATAGDTDPADELPADLDQTPVSRPGDLCQLGRIGFFAAMRSIRGLMTVCRKGLRHGLCSPIPPTTSPSLGHVSGRGRVRHREFVMASGQMTPAQFTRFLATALRSPTRRTARRRDRSLRRPSASSRARSSANEYTLAR
jgi:hypothetical protein